MTATTATPWYASPVWQPFKWTPGNTSAHSGVDLGMPVGTPITAPMDGEIVSTGHELWGGQVNERVMVNGQPYTLTWIHLSRLNGFTPGQKVSAGQVLGYSGTPPPGWGSGAHTHFEATIGNTPAFMGYNPIHPTLTSHPVNPAPFLAFAAANGGGVASAPASPASGTTLSLDTGTSAGASASGGSGGSASGCAHSIGALYPGGSPICLDAGIDFAARGAILLLAFGLVIMAVAIFASHDATTQQAIQTATTKAHAGAKKAAQIAALAV